MMNSWVGVGLLIALIALLAVLVGIVRVRDRIRELNKKIDRLTSLSLNPRTRIAQATMQSGARVPEQDLKQLAHTSRAKRVVVGGDEDSEQHQRLSRGIRQEESDG